MAALARTEPGSDEYALQLECRFYRYAHVTDERERKERLAVLEVLVEDGVRSPNSTCHRNVARAAADGHPSPGAARCPRRPDRPRGRSGRTGSLRRLEQRLTFLRDRYASSSPSNR
jgi:hypothetical protein